MIEVKNVTKIYGKKENKFTAINDVSLTIENKTTTAILGKSGSGKSTMMHIMSGLDRPTSGHIIIDGTDLSTMKARAMDDFRATKMSFIFQSFFVEPHQTCLQNVMLPLEIARAPIRRRRKQAVQALSAVGLQDKLNSPARNLSGGQKQRLAIARAIVNRPQILFADEPTGNLDSSTGESIIKLLFALNRRLGCTVIIVTHDEELAARCQTQIILKDGKLEAVHTNRQGAVHA
jgi:putative ABC transport system ATP-binding protein